MGLFTRVLGKLEAVFGAAGRMARAKAVDAVEVELEELELVFTLLVLGSYVGLPSPPMHLSLELMPEMERELMVLVRRVDTAVTPLSHLFSTLETG